MFLGDNASVQWKMKMGATFADLCLACHAFFPSIGMKLTYTICSRGGGGGGGGELGSFSRRLVRPRFLEEDHSGSGNR